MERRFQLGNIEMELSKGEAFENRTWKYLLPLLREYGKAFTGKINSVFKVACGIGDIVIENSGTKYEKHLFVLLDTKISNRFFLAFIDWIRVQPYYEDDYVFGDIQKSTKHMVVLQLPEKFHNSLEEFKKGRYSKMYDKDVIDNIFKNKPEVKRVLIRDNNYKLKFIEEVNSNFNTNIEDFDIENYELDYPFNTTEETF